MDLNRKTFRGSLFLFFFPLFLFIFTSLIFSNCARKKERKQLVVVKDEFEKVEVGEFVLDEKTGQEFAKNQILIYIVANSKSELEEKKTKVSEFLKAKKGEFSVLGEIEFLSEKGKVGVLLQGRVPAGTPEEIKQIVLELRNFDGSIRAFPNMRMKPNAVLDGRIPLDPLFDSWDETPGGNNWHFEAVNMPGLWKIETQGKVPVAVIEFGIRKHEDLEYDLRRGVDGEGADWAQNHGVSVLGVLGAVGNNSKGIAGTIWRGDIKVYVIDGTLSSLIQSIVFALEDEAKVILFAGGLEWGSVNPEGNPEAEEILEYHREIFSVVFQYVRYYDGLFVQSAGNEGKDARYAGVGASVKDLFPHNILLVGSTNILGKISSFSNRGSLVDIYLPGESIFTTCWGSSGDYCLRSGTSYSAAMGAGVAVLLGSINGDLRSGEIKEMIMRGMRVEGEGENARYVIDFSISGYLAIFSQSGNLDLGLRIPELGDIVLMPWFQIEREAVVEIGNLGPKAVECAVYDDTTVDGDPAYKAPKCPENVEGCSSCGLLDGNGNGGYPEPNQPNTLYGLVQDIPGTGANAPIRIISIQVETMSESGFIQSGPSATDRRNIKVTVRAWGNNPDQWIDVFYTSDANAGYPVFVVLGSYRWDCGSSRGWVSPVVSGTVMCSRTGNETTISFLMSLPAVSPPRKMAIRARIRNSPKTDLDSWRYRRAIVINNSGNPSTLTDYQVLIQMDTASLISQGKMRSDCGDIRFTDSDGQTLLSYWIEGGCNTTDTRIWVKVPTIPANSTRTIYVYYGNPEATSRSSVQDTFIPNSIYVMSGGCSDETNCGYMDNHAEADAIRGYVANICTEYVDRIYWGSVCDNSSPGTGVRDYFYSRFRFLFVPDVSGTWYFAVDSDDGSELVRSGADMYGGIHEHVVIASWYGGHGWCNCQSRSGGINLVAGQGVWMEFLQQEWEVVEAAVVWVLRPGGSWVNLSVANFPGQIYARKYTSPEPGTSIGSEETGQYTFANYWRYRKAIVINNSGNSNTLTDYQVLVRMNTASLISGGKMRSDCGDIRFTDSDGQTLLSYWIEGGCNTTDTRIWVKVPTIPANSTRTIYVYYGNPGAISTSSVQDTFIPNSIYVMSGGCSDETNCGHMDNHAEADAIRGYVANICTKYVDRIYWGSVCDNSSPGTGVRDYFYSRFRFLFVPDVSGTWYFAVDSDDGSELVRSGADMYGGIHEHVVIASWYGAHGWCNCQSRSGGINLVAGQGVWMEFLQQEWEVVEAAVVWVLRPGGSWVNLSVANFPGQIYARKYTSPEPGTSIGSEETGQYTFANYWRYRKAIVINNSGNSNTLTDYQVLVRMDTASLISGGKMRSDCGDIRFTDSDGQTLLSYWIEGGCNTTDTRIWVKVPTIPANSTRTIYVYYGNPEAISTSSVQDTFIPNSIYVMSGGCSDETNCGHMDNHAEADAIRGYVANICTEYVDRIYWGSVCDNSSPGTGVRDYFYSRFRFLFVPDVSGTWYFAVDSDDGSELVRSGADMYGGIHEHVVIASWYGGHGWCNCQSRSGGINLVAGQGVWMEFLQQEWEVVEAAVVWVLRPGGSWVNLSVANFPGQIYARKYTSPEPGTSIGSEETGQYTFANYWRYRKAIVINNSGNSNTLTDYQVLVRMDTASLISQGKMRSDCGDIRFTDSDGQTLLSYWIEGGCNTTDTRIWVKVPTIPANSTRTIYVYYGNPEAISTTSSVQDTFIPNSIYVMSGGCSDETNCGHMDNHAEADAIRGYVANICTKYVDRIYWGSVCDNSGPGTGVRDYFYSRFRFLFVPDVSGTWYFAVDSDDGSELVRSGADMYGGIHEHVVIASWYGAHGWCNCQSRSGGINLVAGQGVWMEFLQQEWEVVEAAVVWVLRPGGSWVNLSVANFPGQIYARKYTSPEPGTSIGAEETGQYTFANYWRYRRGITINNSGNPNTLTDYQVLVRMNTASLISGGKMRGDCGDIRFTDSDGQTLLSYWIEGGCNTTDTRIWVKVPTIPANSTRTIYVYYGNPEAISTSSVQDTFIPNSIYVMSGGCSDETNCGHMDNHAEADAIRGYVANICTEYVDRIYWGSVCDNSSPGTGVRDYFYSRFRFLFVPDVSGTWYFAVDSDEGSELVRSGADMYGGIHEHVVIASWYGGHGWCNCQSRSGGINLVAGQGVWMEFLQQEWEVVEAAVVWVLRPGGSWVNLSVANFPGQIYARKYTSPEPGTSIGAEETTIEDNDDLVFTVQNPPSSFTCGIYDSNFRAPVCYGDGWCGTCNTVPCRDTTSDSAESPAGFYNCGGNEPNQPNTLFSQCQDTSENTSGSLDEQIRRINIKSLAPSGKFEGGELVEASLLVACRSDDQIVIAYASGVTYLPTQLANWRYVTTISCPSGAPITYWYNLHYTLRLDNVEGWHAIRAVLGRCPGCATQTSICPSMTYRDADDFVFYVKAKPPSSLPVCAVYDSYYKTPRCPQGASACSTCELIKSRDSISGTAEQNQPNTLSSTCSDDGPTSAQYLQTESIERIEIKDLSGSGTFQPGGQVEVSVLVYCDPVYPNYLTDYLVLLYSSNADSPTFTRVLTATCTSAGYNLFRTNITLANVAGKHVVRAIFKQGEISSTDTCAGGVVLDDGDTDDLVFDVGVVQAPPNFKLEGIAPDSITLNWSDVVGETRYEIRWTDTYTPDYSKWQVISDNYSANSTWYLDSGLSGGEERCYAIRACSGSVCSDFVWDCTMVPTSSARCAVFDPVWRVPRCEGEINKCSTCNLVVSRDSLPRRQEINTPNAWYSSSCTDGGGGDYYSSRSVERIVLSTGASAFSTGSEISVRVRVFCSSTADYVHLYVSAGTSPISWSPVGSQACSGSNQVEDKTFYFTPSVVGWYVIRAVVTGSGASTCPGGSQDEVDDVVVSVVEGSRPPYSLSVTAYSTETITQYVVSFIDDSGNEDGFAIEGTQDGVSWTRYEWWSDSTTKPGTGSRTIKFSLSSETRWCFRVASFKQVGSSLVLSQWADNATRCVIGVKAPSNLYVESMPVLRTLRFFWQDNSSYESGQNFEWRHSASSSYNRDSVGQNTAYYEKQFPSESIYCFRVTNWWSGDPSKPEEQGSYSQGYSGEVCKHAIGSPYPLYAAFSSSGIRLDWQDNATSNVTYLIQVTDGSTWTTFSEVSSNTANYEFNPGASGRYCYRVRVKSGAVESWASNVVCVNYGNAACSGVMNLNVGLGSALKSVLSDGDMVFVAFADKVSGVSKPVVSWGSATVKWSWTLGSQVSSNICSVSQDRIFVGAGGKIYVIRKRDGAILSERAFGSGNNGCAVSGGRIYLTTSTGYVWKLSSDLKVEGVANAGSAVTTPVIDEREGGYIYVPRTDGVLKVYDLNLVEVGSVNLGGPITYVVLGPKRGEVFAAGEGGNYLYRVTRAGTNLFAKWVNVGGAIKTSPVVYQYGAEVTVIVGLDTGVLKAYGVDSSGNFVQLWSQSLGVAPRGAAVLAGDVVFIGVGNQIQARKVSDGTAAGGSCPYTGLGNISTALDIDGSDIVFGDETGRLYIIAGVGESKGWWVSYNMKGKRAIGGINTHRGLAYEEARYCPYSPTSSGYIFSVIADEIRSDYDGKEIFAFDNKGWRGYLISATGQIIWEAYLGWRSWSLPAVGDIIAGGSKEIAMGMEDARVVVLRSDGGWYQILLCGEIRAVTLADVDGNGDDEIIATSQGCNKTYVIDWDGTSLKLLREYALSSDSGNNSYAVVITYPGNSTIYVAGFSGNLYMFDYANYSTSVVSVAGSSVRLHTPAIGDVDGDGVKEVIVGGDNGVIYIRNLDGTAKGSVDIRGYTGGVGKCMNRISLGDADRDGKDEIYVVASDCTATTGNSYLVSITYFGGGYQVRWGSGPFRGTSSSHVVIGDFDGDGMGDIATVVHYDDLYVWRWDGSMNFVGRAYYSGGGARGGMSVIDLDEDGRQNIIFGDRSSGCVHIFEFGEGTASGQVWWGYNRANPKQNGVR